MCALIQNLIVSYTFIFPFSLVFNDTCIHYTCWESQFSSAFIVPHQFCNVHLTHSNSLANSGRRILKLDYADLAIKHEPKKVNLQLVL